MDFIRTQWRLGVVTLIVVAGLFLLRHDASVLFAGLRGAWYLKTWWQAVNQNSPANSTRWLAASDTLASHWPRAVLLPTLTSSYLRLSTDRTNQLIILGNKLARLLFTEESTTIIWLQNHHELRATGGFLGSALIINTGPSQPIRWEIEDIYTLDNRVTGMAAAPAGINEYLNSGTGLSLVDANWWPDTAISGQALTSLLNSSADLPPRLMIFINTQVVADVVDSLPTKPALLNNENIFGSIFDARQQTQGGVEAKATVLSDLASSLNTAFRHFSVSQWRQLFWILENNSQQRNITAYSPVEDIQQQLIALNVSGPMLPLEVEETDESIDLYFFPIESNVGINKANAGVARNLTITQTSPTTTQLKITWQNLNPATASARPELTRLPGAVGADHTHYANYFRLYTFSTASVSGMLLNNDSIQPLHNQLWTDSRGQTFRELGILVPVLSQGESTLSLTLLHPAWNSASRLLIPHQAGLGPAEYHVSLGGYQQQGTFERDLIIDP